MKSRNSAAAARQVEFTFLQVGVRIHSEDTILQSALEELASDFAAFKSGISDASENLDFRLMRGTAPETRSRVRLGPARVSGWRNQRKALYRDGSSVSFEIVPKERRRIFEIRADSPARARELTYFAILASIGEILEARGYVRLHALGCVIDGRGVVYLGLSGSGKSSLAFLLSKEGSGRLLSDEILFVKAGRIFAFPLRLALAPTVAGELGASSGESLASPRWFYRADYPPKLVFPAHGDSQIDHYDLDVLLVALPRAQLAGILETPWRHPLLLARALASIVIGVHLPQIIELTLRLDNLPRLARMAAQRLLFAVHILRTGRMALYSPSARPSENLLRLQAGLRGKFPA